MRIVFSKDRPAQLDLLLRSLERYAPVEYTSVIWVASDPAYRLGYERLEEQHRYSRGCHEGEVSSFHDLLAFNLATKDETVTFLCDDDVLYRPIDDMPAWTLGKLPDVLTFSLRLASGHGWQCWSWAKLPPYDHGYPGSIDGHTFRTEDLRRMLEGQTIENPLMLETILAQRVHALAEERPLMACYPEQKLVGLDVNTVATDKARPSGKTYPQSPEELNRRFLAGERISLDALDLEDVDGCLVERQFVWEPA